MAPPVPVGEGVDGETVAPDPASCSKEEVVAAAGDAFDVVHPPRSRPNRLICSEESQPQTAVALAMALA